MKRPHAIGLMLLCLGLSAGLAGWAAKDYLHRRSSSQPELPAADEATPAEPHQPPAVPLPAEGIAGQQPQQLQQGRPPQREATPQRPGPWPGLALRFCRLFDANCWTPPLAGLAQRFGRGAQGSPLWPAPGELWEAAAPFRDAVAATMERQFAQPGAYIGAGDRALARLDFLSAVDCFQAARLLDPNNLDAAKGLAISLSAAGRNQEAADAYREILARLPEDRTTKYNLAVALARLARPGEAKELLRDLVEKEPGFLQAWYNLGAIYTAGGELARAREAWEKAAQLAPKLAYPCMMLGETLMDLEEPNEAARAFAQAAQRDPNDPAAYMNLAAASVQIGSYGQAVLATERAAELAPGDAGVWASLGNVRATLYTATHEKRFLQGAIEAWQHSLRSDPNQPEVKDNLDHFRKELAGPATRSGATQE